jgi:hypothetical protein
MAGVFISYRRDEEGDRAMRLYRLLQAELGADQVFIDLNMQLGLDFHERLGTEVGRANVLLAVIGRGWSDARVRDGSHALDDPRDWVRVEIEAALKRPDVLVIPVLVGGADPLEEAELPDSLRGLARRNAIPLRYDTFDEDARRLARSIADHLSSRSAPTPPGTQVRTLTVPVLGATASGKTMYLWAAHDALAHGVDGFFLHAEEPEHELALHYRWQELTEQGRCAPATDPGGMLYRFILRDGFAALAEVRWGEFGSGAMHETPGEFRGGHLLDHLRSAGSLHVLIDADELPVPLGGADLRHVRERTEAYHLTRHIQRAAAERGSVPALAIVLTKADLLLRKARGSPSEVFGGAVEAVRELLPVAFGAGSRTLVCPVSLGDIGEPVDGRVDPVRVAPRWVHKPLLFSLLMAMRTDPRADGNRPDRVAGQLADLYFFIDGEEHEGP